MKTIRSLRPNTSESIILQTQHCHAPALMLPRSCSHASTLPLSCCHAPALMLPRSRSSTATLPFLLQPLYLHSTAATLLPCFDALICHASATLPPRYCHLTLWCLPRFCWALMHLSAMLLPHSRHATATLDALLLPHFCCALTYWCVFRSLGALCGSLVCIQPWIFFSNFLSVTMWQVAFLGQPWPNTELDSALAAEILADEDQEWHRVERHQSEQILSLYTTLPRCLHRIRQSGTFRGFSYS